MQAWRVQTHGVTVSITAGDPALAAAVEEILPPGRPAAGGEQPLARFAVLRSVDGSARVLRDDVVLAGGLDVQDAVGLLDARIRQCIASSAPEMIFVHAGVVVVGGRALILPGPSFSGKTRLVSALLRLGATYSSDEFAVIDPAGLVHPYAKPLSLRGTSGTRSSETAAATLGAKTATEAAPVGIIALTHYEPGARWRPVRGSAADGVLMLLAHAGQTREHPARALEAIHRAADRAVVLQSPRGEALPAATALMASLAGLS